MAILFFFSKAGTFLADNTLHLHIYITNWIKNFERPQYKSLSCQKQKEIEEEYLETLSENKAP